jgi:hypothetical protein
MGDIPVNIKYATMCMRDSIENHHEAPILTHLMYTLQFDYPHTGYACDSKPIDKKQMEREVGLDCALTIRTSVQKVVFYEDLGISAGMKRALDECKKLEIETEIRKLNAAQMKELTTFKRSYMVKVTFYILRDFVIVCCAAYCFLKVIQQTFGVLPVIP